MLQKMCHTDNEWSSRLKMALYGLMWKEKSPHDDVKGYGDR
jgi:hypothetical protein